jgi:hypothetical protein
MFTLFPKDYERAPSADAETRSPNAMAGYPVPAIAPQNADPQA